MKFNPKDNQKEKGKETALTASVEVKITQQEQKGSCSRHKHWNQHGGGDVLDNLHHRIQSQYRPQERHLEYHLFMGYHVSSFAGIPICFRRNHRTGKQYRIAAHKMNLKEE
jgi:hypothetical protein